MIPVFSPPCHLHENMSRLEPQRMPFPCRPAVQPWRYDAALQGCFCYCNPSSLERPVCTTSPLLRLNARNSFGFTCNTNTIRHVQSRCRVRVRASKRTCVARSTIAGFCTSSVTPQPDSAGSFSPRHSIDRRLIAREVYIFGLNSPIMSALRIAATLLPTQGFVS